MTDPLKSAIVRRVQESQGLTEAEVIREVQRLSRQASDYSDSVFNFMVEQTKAAQQVDERIAAFVAGDIAEGLGMMMAHLSSGNDAETSELCIAGLISRMQRGWDKYSERVQDEG